SQTSEFDGRNTPGLSDSQAGLYMKVQLPTGLKMSKLKPGQPIEGMLARDVYSADHKLLSSGDHVRLTVDRLEKRKRARTDHWPGVISLFAPRHESFPIFKSATVMDRDSEQLFDVSMIAASRMREVQAQAKHVQAFGTEQGAIVTGKSNKKEKPPFSMVLE